MPIWLHFTLANLIYLQEIIRQAHAPLIQAVEDTDYKTNEIEQNLVWMNALTYVSGYNFINKQVPYPT
jgi:hypothetical protein